MYHLLEERHSRGLVCRGHLRELVAQLVHLFGRQTGPSPAFPVQHGVSARSPRPVIAAPSHALLHQNVVDIAGHVRGTLH